MNNITADPAARVERLETAAREAARAIARNEPGAARVVLLRALGDR